MPLRRHSHSAPTRLARTTPRHLPDVVARDSFDGGPRWSGLPGGRRPGSKSPLPTFDNGRRGGQSTRLLARVLAFVVSFGASAFHLPSVAAAQPFRVEGVVTDEAGLPLGGVRVDERGTLNTTTTAPDGRYELQYYSPDAVLTFTLFGYAEETRSPAGATRLDVTLRHAIPIAGIEVVGTRRLGRTAVETPSAVDVIDAATLTVASGHHEVNQLLHFAAPSFNANRQSGADGADHIDPAALRGLGPDQTLVLINGKRRHTSSLVNIFGSRGRGSTGTDLNAIPVAAIERIEILRDGASAQYGSDAIAGVINVVLKSSVDVFDGVVSVGAHNARPPRRFDVMYGDDRFDGEETVVSANYGVRLGAGGFLNTTGEWRNRGRTTRMANPDAFPVYRRMFGDGSMESFTVFSNAMMPVGEDVALYAFGGFQFRHTDAYAWSREPDSPRNVPAIYPEGFDPRILSDIGDRSLTVGVRTNHRGWDVDVYTSYGMNRLHYFLDGSLNASLLERSPTRFDAGGFTFSQQTTGARVSRFLPDFAAGLNLAFGAEHRVDRYTIFAGEEASYRNYGIVSVIDGDRVVQLDTLGRPGGSQGFPGFQPINEVDEQRANLGVFADVELDLTERLLLSAATRAERFSDFGSTVTAKLAGRFRVTDAVSVRLTAGTGFRAPSLQQLYYNTIFTDFPAGVAREILLARNDSPITRALGVPRLREETSRSLSAGITFRMGALSATADAYVIDIDDRIVLTGSFEDTDPQIGHELRRLGVGAAQFFTNALDTRTRGVDVVVSWERRVGAHRFRWNLAGNWTGTQLGAIHTSELLAGKEDIYFGSRERAFLAAGAPPRKLNATVEHEYGKLNTSARVSHFGTVVFRDWEDDAYSYPSRSTLDLSAGYRLTDRVRLAVGAMNVLNTYPAQHSPADTETGGLWDAVQMGSSGAFYFARLEVRM